MALDPTVVGVGSQTYRHGYDWRALATYALGIGAKRAELAYLYEGVPGGMRAYPTYAVVPAYEAVAELLGRARAALSQVLHVGQRVVAHGPLPPAGTLVTSGSVTALYDLRRFAELVITTTSAFEAPAGASESAAASARGPLLETEWNILVRGAGGFGGPRPPPGRQLRPPRGRSPDWSVADPSSPEQALIYRLSGDVNPLHADPAVAAQAGFSGPILHGLCTYGFLARAVISRLAGGDPTRLRSLSAQFRNPVWPGEVLAVDGFERDDGGIALQVTVPERPDTVVATGLAGVAKAGAPLSQPDPQLASS